MADDEFNFDEEVLAEDIPEHGLEQENIQSLDPDQSDTSTSGDPDSGSDSDIDLGMDVIPNSIANFNIVVISPEFRETRDIMTLAEASAIIGFRAAQIDIGAPIYIELHPEDNTAIKIATRELKENLSPAIVRRVVRIEDTQIHCEEWAAYELELPHGFIQNNL